MPNIKSTNFYKLFIPDYLLRSQGKTDVKPVNIPSFRPFKRLICLDWEKIGCSIKVWSGKLIDLFSNISRMMKKTLSKKKNSKWH